MNLQNISTQAFSCIHWVRDHHHQIIDELTFYLHKIIFTVSKRIWTIHRYPELSHCRHQTVSLYIKHPGTQQHYTIQVLSKSSFLYQSLFSNRMMSKIVNMIKRTKDFAESMDLNTIVNNSNKNLKNAIRRIFILLFTSQHRPEFMQPTEPAWLYNMVSTNILITA